MATIPGLYQRQATGLVREAGTWSTLVYNINFVSIGLMMMFALQLEPAFYPGGNIIGSYLLSLVIVLPTSLVFAMLAAAMPRSGADYVYVSRILGPRLGMMSSWINTVWWFIYGGVPSAFFARYGLGPLFRSLGLIGGNETFLDIGNWFVTPEGTIITGLVLLAALVAIFSLGLNAYFRVQNVLFGIAVVGLGLVALVMLTSGGQTFVDNFNRFWDPSTGLTGTHAAVIATATADGFAEAPTDFYWTLIPITWIYLELVFNQSSAYIGGEVKRASRIQLWSMPIAAMTSIGIAIVLTWIIQSAVGTTFLGVVGWDPYVSNVLGQPYPMPFSEIAAYASGNLAVALIVGVGFVFWSYTWLPGQILNASRNLLAYGLDGVLPARFASVSERYHTPVFSLVVVGLMSALALYVYATNPDFTTLVGIVAFIVSFMIVSISAIAFPYRRPAMWESSPIAWRFAGLPVISVVGVLSFIALCIAMWAYFNDPLSGVNILDGLSLKPITGEDGNLTKDFARFLIASGTVASGLVIFEISRIIRAGRGIRLEANYGEIPIE